MMKEIEQGNFNDEDAERGWRVGHFIKDKPNFNTRLTEFQWNFGIKRGKRKDKIAYNEKASTLTILIKGKMKIDFPHQKESITLKKQGDYVFFAPGVCHTWKTLKRTKMVGIRWPSIPNDQIECNHK